MISVASCSRKRPNEFVSPDRPGVKVQKTAYFYVLESESDVTSSESDTETVLSAQNLSTDFAKNTSDTSSKASNYGTDRESLAGVEYEVVSLSSDNNRPFDEHSSGTDSDSWKRQKGLAGTSAEEGGSDNSMWGDASSTGDAAAAIFNDRIPLTRRPCVKCKALTSGVPFCSHCYKVRKDFFPPRPKVRKNRNSKNAYKRKLCSKESAKLPLLRSVDSSGPSSQEMLLTPEVPSTTEGLCNVCFKNPKNGAFLHCRWVHIYACYECSIKIWFTSKNCPLCHGKIRTVLKVAIG